MATQIPLDTYHNQKLFSDYFLRERVPAMAGWAALAAEADAARAALRALWAERRPSEAWNEAQTEREWIQPVLEALGHAAAVQVSLRTGLGVKKPDYLLFPDEGAKAAALAAGAPHDEASLAAAGALAVADAKRWNRPLDATVKAGDYDTISANPVVQIDFYLRQTGLRWALLTNGRMWRLYHRESSKGLDTFYEVDLPALIEAGDGAAFRYFYAFFRRDAFVAGGWLDAVLAGSREFAQGVSETLKAQVYEALTALAQGFLALPGNGLEPTAERLKEIYDNSLIVLYRLLFVAFAESRELLPARPASPYFEYSLRRIVGRLAAGRPTVETRTRLWGTLLDLWKIINEGDAALGVPAYNGGLFSPARHPFLEQFAVGDSHLQRAIELLAFATAPDGQRVAVDYRDLAVRHLGAIYEGLLEFTLEVEAGAVRLLNDKGERKASGSYYTPDYIVQYIVEQTLGPLVDELAEKHAEPRALAEAILRLNVLDPAAGSGHFLVGATDYLAQRLLTVGAEAPTAEAASGETELAYWRRRVVTSCIYGVDLNPLAVELAKLSLWLNTVARDKPLSFLDHHIRVGNSLVGARLEALGAAQPTRGTSKAAKAAAARAEAQSEAGQADMFAEMGVAHTMRTATRFMEDIEATVQSTVADVHEIERAFLTGVRATTARYRRVADLWTAQHFGVALGADDWKALREYLLRGNEGFVPPRHAETLAEAARIAGERRFFHWELEFPEVFFDSRSGALKGDDAGFDAVIGNPPYIRAENADKVERKYIMTSGQFKTVWGRFDVYAIFIERGMELLSRGGLFGYIVPDAVLTINYASQLQQWMLREKTIVNIVDARGEDVFPGIGVSPCVLILRNEEPSEGHNVHIVSLPNFRKGYFERDIPLKLLQEMSNNGIRIDIDASTARIKPKVTSVSTPLSKFCYIITGLVGHNSETGESIKRLIHESRVGPLSKPYIEAKEWRGRYSWLLPTKFIEYRPSEMHRPKFIELFESPKILVQRLSSDALIPVTLDEQAVYVNHVINCCVKAEDVIHLGSNRLNYDVDTFELPNEYDLHYLLSLIASRLLGYFHTKFLSPGLDIYPETLRQLPIRRIAFTTPDDERARLRGEGIARYEAALRGDDAALLDFVAARLAAAPEQSDVVHDLLAHLAERMIALHRERQARLDDFWLDLEGASDPATFKALRGKGKAESTLAKHEALRPFVREGSGSSRSLDDALAWNEEAFKGFVALLARRVPSLAALVRVYRAHSGDVQRLAAAIARTDALIDQIVYGLYGLTEEEVEIVERQG